MTRKRILIYLHTKSVSWLVMDETNQVQQFIADGNLADLTSLAGDCIIQVIIPSQTILLTAAKLPQLSPQRVLQALPFTLEEQLIDDVNTLHFSVGEYQSNNSFPVAVTAKEKMDGWLSELKQANIMPDELVPALLTLPFTPDNWYACIDDEIGMVRTGYDSGFSCDKENLAVFLELRLAAAEQKPASIHLYNFSSAPAAMTLSSSTLNEITVSKDQFLEYTAKWLGIYPYINLLQGAYQLAKKPAETKKIWIMAGCLAVAWIGLVLFNNLGSLLILHHATAASEQMIDKIYRRNFPQASAVIAPRQRMEEKLKKLSVKAGNNNFLSWLSIIGSSLSKAKNIRILSMDFRNNQMTLDISAMTFNDLDNFTQTLTQEGLKVKNQNAGIAGTIVKANLLISQGTL